MSKEQPQPGAYRPYVAARAPFPPKDAPVWRVLVHRQFADEWGELANRVGESNAKELWAYLTTSPDAPPDLGKVIKFKGGKGKGAKMAPTPTYHYSITGAGRIDFQVFPKYKTAPDGDEHKVVKIVGIDYGSH